MDRILLISIFLGGLLSPEAWARRGENLPPPDQEPPSSEFRTHSANLLMAGIGLSDLLGASFAAEKNIDSSWAAQAQYLTTTDFLFEQRNFLSLRAKFYIGNSFYVALGPSYLRRHADFAFTDAFSVAFSKYGAYNTDAIQEELGIDGSFGNQWQWEKMTLGFEWLGGFHKLKQISRKITITSSKEVTDKEIAAVEDYLDRRQNPWRALMFYMGVTL